MEQLPLQVDILIKKVSDIIKLALVQENSIRIADDDHGQLVGEAAVLIEKILRRD